MAMLNYQRVFHGSHYECPTLGHQHGPAPERLGALGMSKHLGVMKHGTLMRQLVLMDVL